MRQFNASQLHSRRTPFSSVRRALWSASRSLLIVATLAACADSGPRAGDRCDGIVQQCGEPDVLIPEHLACVDGVCRTVCRGNNESMCDTSEICRVAVCLDGPGPEGAECTEESDCAGSLRCLPVSSYTYVGACEHPRQDGGFCSEPEHCAEGYFCSPRQICTAPRDVGGECWQPSHCASGLCFDHLCIECPTCIGACTDTYRWMEDLHTCYHVYGTDEGPPWNASRYYCELTEQFGTCAVFCVASGSRGGFLIPVHAQGGYVAIDYQGGTGVTRMTWALTPPEKFDANMYSESAGRRRIVCRRD